MKELALICGLLSGAFGVGSTVALVKGTAAVPWSMQSWTGESEPEKRFKRAVRCWFIGGMWCLGAAFVLSAISAAAGYLS